MKILAIDPGPTESAYCVIDGDTYKPIEFGKVDNQTLLSLIKIYSDYTYAELPLTLLIEMIASYGMPVGKEVFDTCVWIGRFIERGLDKFDNIEYVYRKDVKINLCNSLKAKDSNIRCALIDRFGIVGIKKNPGWFYGFKGDIWSAYAIGVTYLDNLSEK